MLFQTVASVALLATSAAAAVEARQPYRLAVMALPGQSLMRRDTSGYTPDQKHCKAGNTCAEACGSDYQQCSGGKPDVAHCFNPKAGESCCTDNSGNSCEAGYYCAHDNKAQTWCCPQGMDLAACAAAYTASGLVAATAKPPSSTTSQAPTTTSIPPTTTSSSSSVTTTTTESSIPVFVTTSEKNTTTMTTTICASSSGKSTAWTMVNSTVSTGIPTQPSAGMPSVTGILPVPTNVNAAAASGVSALLLVAAGVVALL